MVSILMVPNTAELLDDTGIEPRLARYLEVAGQIRAVDLQRAKAAATAAGKRLDQALVDLGIATEASLAEILIKEFGVGAFDPKAAPSDPVLSEFLPPAYLASSRAIPVAATAETLMLAMVDPFDDFTAQAIALKTRRGPPSHGHWSVS